MTLPPGPRMPRALQTLGWIARPMPFMEQCRDRYGDAFTLRIAHEGTWVLLSDPRRANRALPAARGPRPPAGGTTAYLPASGPNPGSRSARDPPIARASRCC